MPIKHISLTIILRLGFELGVLFGEKNNSIKTRDIYVYVQN